MTSHRRAQRRFSFTARVRPGILNVVVSDFSSRGAIGTAQVIALPPLARRRAPPVAWLSAAVLAAAAGTGTAYLEGQVRSAAEQRIARALDADAEKLASLIDAEARALHLRAD